MMSPEDLDAAAAQFRSDPFLSPESRAFLLGRVERLRDRPSERRTSRGDRPVAIPLSRDPLTR